MENYWNKSDWLKLDDEELELLLGPEDSEVNLRFFVDECKQEELQESRDLQHEREK